jgi:2-methylcitrate dehydratase PrpD
MGYEIALRAGIALHATAADYHTSGAWNALGCAAIVSRSLGLSAEQTCHALGAAEYHAPRSQMLRCIDHPTMVKDGSGWGALAGVSAAFLAADGFTGAPAILLDGPAEIWRDLGQRWRIMEQYFKPWPVCRWAQPAVEAALGLMTAHRIEAEAVAGIEIASFREAVRLGAKAPETTEEAQYALGFPVAAAMARGRLGADEILPHGLGDPAVAAMLRRVTVLEDDGFSAAFPAERHARIALTLKDGRVLRSGVVAARGDPEAPLSDQQLLAKFRMLAQGLSAERVSRIERAVAALDREAGALPSLLAAILAPIGQTESASEAAPVAGVVRRSSHLT